MSTSGYYGVSSLCETIDDLDTPLEPSLVEAVAAVTGVSPVDPTRFGLIHHFKLHEATKLREPSPDPMFFAQQRLAASFIEANQSGFGLLLVSLAARIQMAKPPDAPPRRLVPRTRSRRAVHQPFSQCLMVVTASSLTLLGIRRLHRRGQAKQAIRAA